MPTKYETPRGAAATNAKRKYNEKTYDRIYPMVQKGKKALYQKAAEAGGFGSLNDFIESAADERAAAILGMSKEEFRAAYTAGQEKG